MAKSKTKANRGNKICSAGIAWAKRTFDRYPSAYANAWASKEYKKRGGTWSGKDNRVAKKKRG